QLSALVYDCNGLVTLDANNQVVANNAKWMLYTVHTGPAQACAPSTETCNGLDDDCDGQVDESLSTTSPCSAGVGACARTGTTTTACSNGAMATIACSATAGTPTTEVCGNGVDEDCNGADLACSSPAPSPAPVAPVPTVGISRMTDAGGQTNPPSPWKPKQAFFCNQGEVACGGVAISLFSTQVGELKCCPVVDFTIGNEVAAIGPLGPGSDLICPVDTAACGYGGQLSPTKYVDMVRCCEVSGASVDVSNPQLLSLKNSNPGGKLPNPVSCAANEVVCGTRNDQKNYAEDAYCCSIK
ncbi:MAG TPA: MopE-related protein, partial [Candidatus Nanoarchaeia archaeon]|nr:MopE-related protein [Candidatus Nanoarchaeia archaeon]